MSKNKEYKSTQIHIKRKVRNNKKYKNTYTYSCYLFHI